MSRDIMLVSDSGNGRMRACRQAGLDLMCTAELDGEVGRALTAAAADADGIGDISEWLRASGYGFVTDGSFLALDGTRPSACVVHPEPPKSLKSAVVQGIASTTGAHVRGSGSVVTCRSSASKLPAASIKPVSGFGKRGVHIVDPVQNRGACAVTVPGFCAVPTPRAACSPLSGPTPRPCFVW